MSQSGDLFSGFQQDTPNVAGPTEREDESHADGSAGPLAARMRPRSIDEFEGQDQLLEPGRALRGMLDRGTLSSMILWGPPGCGKTTLARLLAAATDATFVQISAVSGGVKQIRELTAQAKTRKKAGRGTVLFCDEIHRFNKGQQDAFLPHVEDGTIVLIGATTENPSFEVVRPLLSRAPVYVLEPLGADAIGRVLRRAAHDPDRGLGSNDATVSDEAVDFIADAADGDARRALGVLEAASALVGEGGHVDLASAREALQHRFAAYDKGGESHYNLISALHKSIRSSDPDGSLYWLARMLEAGEDPMYLARRLVRIASEDIGLADPAAVGVTVAARDAFHFLGSPEGDLALAEACLYLATAPKSNRAYRAFKAARQLARDTPAAPVPHHLRNAPTSLMKDLGYGKGYRYDPDEPEGVADQRTLPDNVETAPLYEPNGQGYEARVRERLKAWADARRRGHSDTTDR